MPSRCSTVHTALLNTLRAEQVVIDTSLSDDDLTARIAELGLGVNGGVVDRSTGEVCAPHLSRSAGQVAVCRPQHPASLAIRDVAQ